MELKSKEALLLELALQNLIESHKAEIEEIKALEDSYFETKLSMNKFRAKPLTIEALREREIQKEKDKIAEIQELIDKLFFSNSNILIVSNKIKLMLTNN